MYGKCGGGLRRLGNVMADLRVTDAVMTTAQQGFAKTAARVTRDAAAVRNFDPDGAGADVLAEAIRRQDGVVASGLADVAAGLNALANDVAAANQAYGRTDRELGVAARYGP
jgi:hypothetical protein